MVFLLVEPHQSHVGTGSMRSLVFGVTLFLCAYRTSHNCYFFHGDIYWGRRFIMAQLPFHGQSLQLLFWFRSVYARCICHTTVDFDVITNGEEERVRCDQRRIPYHASWVTALLSLLWFVSVFAYTAHYRTTKVCMLTLIRRECRSSWDTPLRRTVCLL